MDYDEIIEKVQAELKGLLTDGLKKFEMGTNGHANIMCSIKEMSTTLAELEDAKSTEVGRYLALETYRNQNPNLEEE